MERRDVLKARKENKIYLTLNSAERKLRIQGSKTLMFFASSFSQNRFFKYLPVGFRSRKIVNMLVATFGYFIIFWFGLNLEINDADSNAIGLWPTRIFFIVVSLVIVFFNHNYLEIQDKLKIKKYKKRSLRILNLLLCDYIICVLLLLLLIFICSLATTGLFTIK